MRLYATVTQAFTDDDDFIDDQAVERARVFSLVEAKTVRLQAVAVDANGDLVTAAGSMTATVLELIPRKESTDSIHAGRKPYVVLEGGSGTLTLGTGLEVLLQRGSYAFRFTGAASIPGGATHVRIFIDDGRQQ